jgi:hypothetical protein
MKRNFCAVIITLKTKFCFRTRCCGTLGGEEGKSGTSSAILNAVYSYEPSVVLWGYFKVLQTRSKLSGICTRREKASENRDEIGRVIKRKQPNKIKRITEGKTAETFH